MQRLVDTYGKTFHTWQERTSAQGLPEQQDHMYVCQNVIELGRCSGLLEQRMQQLTICVNPGYVCQKKSRHKVALEGIHGRGFAWTSQFPRLVGTRSFLDKCAVNGGESACCGGMWTCEM